MEAPRDVKSLLDKIQETAVSFGFAKEVNAIFRDTVSKSLEKSTEDKSTEEKGANFWFGFIREDESPKGVYNGLSFVVFPEKEKKRCLVSIGIGSESLGKDSDLAANPGFRRSFMRLVKAEENTNAKFFFKLRFDDMDTSTPGLQEELENEEYEDILVNTATKYNADTSKEAPGLLPAAFIVDYTTEGGWKLIKAWLAQYAEWRNWEKFKNGSEKKKIKKNIKDAINNCKVDAVCPKESDIYKILIEKKYVVLQGAPGCGKTWSANKIATDYFKGENDEVVFTQFHAETTYSDFVYGIRPTLNGTTLAYKGAKGVLLDAIDKATLANEKGGKVLLIIDEINRANLANVLGPVFYLFENNAEREHNLNLGTCWDSNNNKEEKIEISRLPDNLYVLATMNTADKSLAVVDFALRRRFSWVTLRPHKLNKEVFTKFDGDFFDKIDKLFSKYATDEELNLQPGQSYFMDEDRRRESIVYGIMPLMKEYFAEGFLLAAKEEFAQLFASETDVFMYE